jgi:hypothetical protein
MCPWRKPPIDLSWYPEKVYIPEIRTSITRALPFPETATMMTHSNMILEIRYARDIQSTILCKMQVCTCMELLLRVYDVPLHKRSQRLRPRSLATVFAYSPTYVLTELRFVTLDIFVPM